MLSKKYKGSRLEVVYGLIVVTALISVIFTFVGSFLLGFFTIGSFKFGIQVLGVTFLVGLVLAMIFEWFADLFELIWFIPMLLACAIDDSEFSTE